MREYFGLSSKGEPEFFSNMDQVSLDLIAHYWFRSFVLTSLHHILNLPASGKQKLMFRDSLL